MTSFAFDPTLGFETLQRMKRAPDGAVTLGGDAWAHAAMAALLGAEFLAAEAGVVPFFTVPETGERGVLLVGAARERIDQAPEDVRTLYLATHALVRATHAQALAATGTAPELADPDDLGEPVTLIIALVVVSIAAIVGTAWYFTSRSSIEVEGRNVRTTALAADASALAREQLARTGKIDPGAWELFKEIADAEAGHGAMPLVAGGAVAAAALGFLAWRGIKNGREKKEARR